MKNVEKHRVENNKDLEYNYPELTTLKILREFVLLFYAYSYVAGGIL